jgi:hypothetical protein
MKHSVTTCARLEPAEPGEGVQLARAQSRSRGLALPVRVALGQGTESSWRVGPRRRRVLLPCWRWRKSESVRHTHELVPVLVAPEDELWYKWSIAGARTEDELLQHYNHQQAPVTGIQWSTSSGSLFSSGTAFITAELPTWRIISVCEWYSNSTTCNVTHVPSILFMLAWSIMQTDNLENKQIVTTINTNGISGFGFLYLDWGQRCLTVLNSANYYAG